MADLNKIVDDLSKLTVLEAAEYDEHGQQQRDGGDLGGHQRIALGERSPDQDRGNDDQEQVHRALLLGEPEDRLCHHEPAEHECGQLRELGVEVRLWSLDDDAEAVWDGESMGEIQVRGPWVARSYWGERDPERFAEGRARMDEVGGGAAARRSRQPAGPVSLCGSPIR